MIYFFVVYVQNYQVADGALKCFASLADRFIRRGIDPAPLAEHNLMDVLLSRLSSAATSSNVMPSTPRGQASSESKSSPSVSTIISLLSTLCRGSPSITYVRLVMFGKINRISCLCIYLCLFMYIFRICYDPSCQRL